MSIPNLWMAVLLTRDTVKDHSQHTIGVEFSSRTVRLGEKRIKLQVCQDKRRTESNSRLLNNSFGIRQAKNGFGALHLRFRNRLSLTKALKISDAELLPWGRRGNSCLRHNKVSQNNYTVIYLTNDLSF
jgi:hypothetical protein